MIRIAQRHPARTIFTRFVSRRIGLIRWLAVGGGNYETAESDMERAEFN